MTIDQLPALNAILNGVSTILLVAGFVLIRRGKWRAHGVTMVLATLSSTLFLVGYVAHKWLGGVDITMSRFPNLAAGWKYAYWFAILIPHVILAIAMLPFIYLGLYRAYRRDWAGHRRVNRYTIWVWLYVSVTGVLIYWLLYHLFPTLDVA